MEIIVKNISKSFAKSRKKITKILALLLIALCFTSCIDYVQTISYKDGKYEMYYKVTLSKMLLALAQQEKINSLESLFPDAKCELKHRSHFQLLVAVVLSAQTTDRRVNQVTEVLFDKYQNGFFFLMGLFTDIEFDDDESIIGHHYDDEAKKEICDDYVKIYSDFYGQHMKCSLIYEIVDDKLACFAETHSNSIMPDKNKNNDKYDDFVLPFDKTDINLMVKFKSAYKIEYMRGKIITYSPSRSARGTDEELFLLRYANDLMNNHGCRIDEIIFTDEEEERAWTLDSFDITMCYNRREAVANTPPLSEEFCK